MVTWLLSIVSGLIVAITTFGVTRFYDATRVRRKSGHLNVLAEGQDIQIVIPDFHAGWLSIYGTDEKAEMPPNVRVMPMAEGGAIAEAVLAWRGLGKRNRISISTQDAYQDTHGLTILIGGPSVNRLTGNLLKRCFPKFQIKYPEHVASYGSISYDVTADENGSLLEDYGFIAVSRTPTGKRCVALFGVWAFGTLIATLALLDRVARGNDIWNSIREKKDFLVVVHCELDGLEYSNIRIIGYEEV
ncbi:hypothetical protein AB0H49_08360 [Nocardia sp. NPDC050713]|uniref:hypothetical protein n=1 Tax=unclassified Nocardia TaxID=2637762 RepID=UPI0033A243BD